MLRIGFIGSPGSGKTTLARAVAGFIRQHTKYKTVELVSEYARQFITKYGIDSLSDQVRIMNKQREEEDKFPLTTDILITDSPIFMGFVYALDMRQEGNQKHTMLINDIFKDMNKMNEIPRYDIIYHLPPTLKPTKDGVRAAHQFDDQWRNKMDQRIKAVFEIFQPRQLVTIQSSDLNERIKECTEHINAFVKL